MSLGAGVRMDLKLSEGIIRLIHTFAAENEYNE